MDTRGRVLPGRWRPRTEEGDLWGVPETQEAHVAGQHKVEQSIGSGTRWEGRCSGQFIHHLVGKGALEVVPV